MAEAHGDKDRGRRDIKRQGEERAHETRVLTQRPRHREADEREILKRVYVQERGKRDKQRERHRKTLRQRNSGSMQARGAEEEQGVKQTEMETERGGDTRVLRDRNAEEVDNDALP